MRAPGAASATTTRASSRIRPPYADIVVDANSGHLLHGTSADALRHPASLTKIMTLYLLFEQMEAGKFRLDSRLEVSEHAAQQAPSKLGLRPGQTISVEDAIRALVTKSANDVAAVVAEAIGGDEETFARMMTRKARVLGMSRTVYANASGLPDPDQVTTARDQATLGRAIQDRFPREYRYFATPTFVYRGWAMRNHNKLLGRVHGLDGIKTGYTRASGFNLVTSVRRGPRHIVAVVLGGTLGRGARCAYARADRARRSPADRRSVPWQRSPRALRSRRRSPDPPSRRRSMARLARADAMAPITTNSVAEGDTSPAPHNPRAPPVASSLSHQPKPGSAEPINPLKVKTITVKAGNVQTAMLVPISPAPTAMVAPPHFAKSAAAPVPAAPPVAEKPATPAAYQVALGALCPGHDRLRHAASSASARPWIIQVGAFPKETEAQDRLREAQSLAKGMLAKTDPFTERVVKGSQGFTARALPASIRAARKPPANTSSATRSPAWRSRTRPGRTLLHIELPVIFEDGASGLLRMSLSWSNTR